LSSKNSEWDIISDVQELHSVFSFESLPFSYKDALLMKQSTEGAQVSVKDDKEMKVVTTVPKTQRGDAVFVDEENHDSFFILNGCKGSRGGRLSCMFNTNQRHARRGYTPYRSRENRDRRRRARRCAKVDLKLRNH